MALGFRTSGTVITNICRKILVRLFTALTV
jgi:hypothetical protein